MQANIPIIKLRVSTTPVHAISDDLDILIAFDQETIYVNHHEMKRRQYYFS